MAGATSHRVFHVRGRSLDLTTPKVMGILNLTPDSFSDGGRFLSKESALERVAEMAAQGADIIDVGGESTRPGSAPVPLQTEIKRVIPLLEELIPSFPKLIFSIDTTKLEVARQALQCGVHILNDVSGLQMEPELATLCGKFGAGFVLMHCKGEPRTMQIAPRYDDLFGEIESFFLSGIRRLKEAGVTGIFLDPGIGFGKTLQHNLQVVSGLDKFSAYEYPILIGASRKSMVGQLLDNRPVEGRLAGTLAVHYHCLLKGARVLRVHDVQAAKDSVRIYNAVLTADSEPPKTPLD